MGFNSAFKGLMYIHMYINESVSFSILSRNNLPELSTCVNR